MCARTMPIFTPTCDLHALQNSWLLSTVRYSPGNCFTRSILLVDFNLVDSPPRLRFLPPGGFTRTVRSRPTTAFLAEGRLCVSSSAALLSWERSSTSESDLPALSLSSELLSQSEQGSCLIRTFACSSCLACEKRMADFPAALYCNLVPLVCRPRPRF